MAVLHRTTKIQGIKSKTINLCPDIIVIQSFYARTTYLFEYIFYTKYHLYTFCQHITLSLIQAITPIISSICCKKHLQYNKRRIYLVCSVEIYSLTFTSLPPLYMTHEKILGKMYRIGTKSHAKAVAQKKHFDDLLESETK